MENDLKITLYSVVLDCPDPMALAAFYGKLTGWIVAYSDEDCAVLAAPGTAQGAYPGITFQKNPDYAPPVWPEAPGAQQQMEHLDFAVNDLEKAVRHALNCGARLADEQFSDGWTVMLDPAGHPFCLCMLKHIFDSPDFALR